MKINRLSHWLEISKYDREKARNLITGFAEGFDIGYRGAMNRKETANNIPLHIGTYEDIWQKMLKESKLGRYAGQYENIPFEFYIQSPIGLVPKAGGR